MSGGVSFPDLSGPKRICWLASYPKSGNTWTRLLLSNLLGDATSSKENISIELAGSISSNRVLFDNLTGLTSSDLTDDEIDLLRPKIYRAAAETAENFMFTKVHDAYHDNGQNEPIFPADCSFGVIYLVRNPLDVVVSYAYHQGHEDFQKTADQLNTIDHKMSGGAKSQLRQKTLGWTGHYRSWHEQDAIPILTIRYEDMIADTAACLSRMAEFLQFEAADLPTLIEHAVEQSRFERLREKEDKAGFKERPEKSVRFFRSGRSGEGAERLVPDLQRKIVDFNLPLMEELGYIQPE